MEGKLEIQPAVAGVRPLRSTGRWYAMWLESSGTASRYPRRLADDGSRKFVCPTFKARTNMRNHSCTCQTFQLAVLLTAIACGNSTEPDNSGPYGRYVLRTVDGCQPTCTFGVSQGVVEVYSGSVQLNDDNTYERRTSLRVTTPLIEFNGELA